MNSVFEQRIGVGMREWTVPAQQPTGEINGIPSIRGKLIKVCGPLCLVETLDGTLFEAHKDWFVPDADASKPKDEKSEAKPRKQRTPQPLLDFLP